MVQLETRRRFTVDDYHRMGETGILGEDERVELIDGEIVRMSPIGSPHHSTVMGLTHRFVTGVGDRARVAIQGPVRLGPHDEPEPDVAVLRPRMDKYRSGLPTPTDVLLIVEVADPSLAYDHNVKAPLYARAGIPEYWVWDVSTGDVTVYRGPAALGYQEIVKVKAGGVIFPLAFPDLEVRMDDV